MDKLNVNKSDSHSESEPASPFGAFGVTSVDAEPGWQIALWVCTEH